VSHHDLYLNHSAVKSGVFLPTILEGAPLEFSDLKLNLESRYFFGLYSIEHDEVVGVSFDEVALEAMCKLQPIEVLDSNQVEVLSGNIVGLTRRLWSDGCAAMTLKVTLSIHARRRLWSKFN
jgi:hypothetical protein